jgi:hypothetical protein
LNDFVKGMVDQVLSVKSADSGAESAIQRPNYQRKNARSRLVTFDIITHPQPAEMIASNSAVRDDAALRIVNLVPPLKQHSIPTMVANDTGPSSYLKKGKTEFSVIENAERRTIHMLGMQCSPGASIGIACSENCTLSQIFAVSSVAGEFPELLIDLTWSEKEDTLFSFRCAGKSETVHSAINKMQQSILNTPAVYQTETPSDILLRKLKIPAGFVAGLDCVSFTALLPLIDDYWKQYPESCLDFILSESWVLVRGVHQEAEEALQHFLQRIV